MKKIGFLGGSFDPIHFGHLNLAVEILEKCQLDEILFCPAFCSPFKEETPPEAKEKDRLKMVELAIEDFSKFRVTSIEIEKKTPSFTINTIRELIKDQNEYHLILAEEVALDFFSWKEAEELFHLAPPFVGKRHQSKNDLPSQLQKRAVITRVLEISSTDIRDRVKKNLNCHHLLPRKTLDYILSSGLYSRQ